jgi:hypothetical protein
MPSWNSLEGCRHTKGRWREGCQLLSTDGQHLTISYVGEGAYYDRGLTSEPLTAKTFEDRAVIRHSIVGLGQILYPDLAASTMFPIFIECNLKLWSSP